MVNAEHLVRDEGVAVIERQAENRGLHLCQCSLDRELARDFARHSQ